MISRLKLLQVVESVIFKCRVKPKEGTRSSWRLVTWTGPGIGELW